jgi:hypothetical protein
MKFMKNSRKPIRRPEQALQRACVQLLEAFYEPMPDVFWTAINPVPAKSKAVAGVSKAMGLKAGVFDMLFIRSLYMPRHEALYGAALPFFIEFKAAKGKLSPSQIARQVEIESIGIDVFIVDTVEKFVDALHSKGISPKRKLTLRGK